MQLFLKNWDKGLVNRIEKESAPRGSASDCLNWHFLGDRIELRRGQQLLGGETAEPERVTFVKTARRYDGTEVLFWGYLRKFLYYDDATGASVEIGSDLLPVDASGEDVSSTLYQSLAGSFLLASSPNSSIYKIPAANPASAVDLQEDTYRGHIKAMLGRLALWNRKDKYGGGDKTGIYLSAIDKDSLADYPRTTAEDVGTGDGTERTFAGTLAFKAAAPKKTVHFMRFAGGIASPKNISAITAASSAVVSATSHGLGVGDVVVIQGVVGMTQINNLIGVVATAPDADTVTLDINSTGFSAYSSDGTIVKAELFVDDRSGGLVGSMGGSGTINYATGTFSVTFVLAVISGQNIVADYYTEDSTDEGIADFEKGDGTSIGDSQVFRQDDAGFAMGVASIGSDNICLHTHKAYNLRLISSEDMTNLIYRERLGVPNHRAWCATADGIYYVDVTDTKLPAIRILTPSNFGLVILPKPISDALDLSGYAFDKAVVFEWNEYLAVACRTNDETINNRLLLYHRVWKTWEIHDCRVSDMDSKAGALIAGDSGSANVFKLFAGLADQDAIIQNFVTLNDDTLGKEGVKDVRRMKVAGEIGDDQELEISYAPDNEPFTVAATIRGDGSYVDQAQRKRVGNFALGEIIGGGQAEDDAIFASPYQLEFFVGTKRFQRIRLKFEAKQVGYCSVSEVAYVDMRDKGLRLPTKYVA
jgi:hypothetical protein